MCKRKIIKLALVAACTAACLLIASVPAFAQCAMCRTALTNSPEAAKLAENFNKAVFVLLIPPVLLFCGIFIAAYKFRKAPDEEGQALSLPRLLLEKVGARLRRKKLTGMGRVSSVRTNLKI
ncbi:MAG TPA: hypothetical protein VF779_09715 [Pyrinomonadaceae bacterium]